MNPSVGKKSRGTIRRRRAGTCGSCGAVGIAVLSILAVAGLGLSAMSAVGLSQKAPAKIRNGDFERGDLSGWEVFATEFGTLGGAMFPACELFDTNGDGQATWSAKFKVGQRSRGERPSTLEGGGLSTTIETLEGTFQIAVDVASTYSSPHDRRNLAGGRFELLVDGVRVARHDIGPIDNGATTRATMRGHVQLAAGSHEVRLLITRPFRSLPNDSAPLQYLDNVSLTLVTSSPDGL